MKKSLKILVALSSLLFIAPLAACDGSNNGDTIPAEVVEKLDYAKENITVPAEVEDDFTLPVSSAGGVTISWVSNNPCIAINGVNAVVERPTDADVDVTLTATFACETHEVTKDYVVKVKAVDLSAYTISTVAQVKEAADDAEVTLRGVVSKCYPYQNKTSGDILPSGIYLTDETGTIHIYGSNFAGQVTEGQEVIVSATKTNYYGAIQVKLPTLELVLAENKTMPLNNVIEGKTVAEVVASSYTSGENGIANNVYKLTGQIYKNEGTDSSTGDAYVNYYFSDDAGTSRLNCYFSGSAAVIPQFAWMDEYVGQDITVAFVINSANSSGKWRGHIIHIYE